MFYLMILILTWYHRDKQEKKGCLNSNGIISHIDKVFIVIISFVWLRQIRATWKEEQSPVEELPIWYSPVDMSGGLFPDKYIIWEGLSYYGQSHNWAICTG